MPFQLEIYLIRRRIKQSLKAEARLRTTLENHKLEPDEFIDAINNCMECRVPLVRRLAEMGATYEDVEIPKYIKGFNKDAVKAWRAKHPNYKRNAVMKHMDKTHKIFKDGTNGQRP